MPPREPLIVQVPTALSMVIAQVRREDCRRDMNTKGRQVLLEHLYRLTRAFVPEVEMTNRSTKARLDIVAKVHGETLFVAQSKAEKLVFAAGDTIDLPYHPRFNLSPEIETSLKKLIAKRLPRIQELHRLNQGLPEHTHARRDEDGIQFTIEGLSEEGFQRVVKALRPLINRDRFHRDDPV
jgi:hypothetical protein